MASFTADVRAEKKKMADEERIVSAVQKMLKKQAKTKTVEKALESGEARLLDAVSKRLTQSIKESKRLSKLTVEEKTIKNLVGKSVKEFSSNFSRTFSTKSGKANIGKEVFEVERKQESKARSKMYELFSDLAEKTLESFKRHFSNVVDYFKGKFNDMLGPAREYFELAKNTFLTVFHGISSGFTKIFGKLAPGEDIDREILSQEEKQTGLLKRIYSYFKRKEKADLRSELGEKSGGLLGGLKKLLMFRGLTGMLPTAGGSFLGGMGAFAGAGLMKTFGKLFLKGGKAFFKKIFWPIEILIAVFKGITTFMNTEGSFYEKWKAGLKAAFYSILELPEQLVNWVLRKFGISWQLDIRGYIDKTFEIWESTVKWLFGIVKKPFEWIGSLFSGFGETLKEWLPSWITDPITGFFSTIGDWFGDKYDWVIEKLDEHIIDPIRKFFKNISDWWNKTSWWDKVKGAGSLVGGAATAVGEHVVGTAKKAYSTAESYVSSRGISKPRVRKLKEIFMKEGGYTEEQASGLVGNFIQESGGGLSTEIRGDQGKAVGIAQWHPDRFRNLLKFAERTTGSAENWKDLETQGRFVLWELENTERAAGEALRKAKSYQEATGIVSSKYERAGKPHLGSRIGYAKVAMGIGVGEEKPKTQKQVDYAASSIADAETAIINQQARDKEESKKAAIEQKKATEEGNKKISSTLEALKDDTTKMAMPRREKSSLEIPTLDDFSSLIPNLFTPGIA